MIMKMMISTSRTSINGVTFISHCGPPFSSPTVIAIALGSSRQVVSLDTRDGRRVPQGERRRSKEMWNSRKEPGVAIRAEKCEALLAGLAAYPGRGGHVCSFFGRRTAEHQ